MQCEVFGEMFGLMHDVEGGVGGRFNAAIFAQERVFSNNAGGEVGNAGGGRVSIEEIAEKDIGFGVQLLVTLHCFSGAFAGAFSGSISMLDMVEKDSVGGADVEVGMVIADAAWDAAIGFLVWWSRTCS